MDNEQCAKKPKLEEVPTVSEGKAQILVTNERVFYNPVQEFNRDLSIAVLTIFVKDRFNEALQKNKLEKDVKIGTPHDVEGQKGITILEALSATGLRSIRYAKEVEGVRQIVANDISVKAVDSIRQNVLHNGVENLVTPYHEDATLLMYQRRRNRFDAVDLDPYGCPSMYLDGAVQCVSDGGILLVTATDMAVLAGNVPETCYWEKKHPVKREKLAVDSSAARILNASSTTDISLAMHPLANPISRQRHLSRFQQNPTVNWGPGVRSRIRVDLENTAEDSKKVRNQNKNSKKKSAMAEQQIVQQ